MNDEMDRLIRREFGLGKREAPGRVHYAQDPRLPQFRFEWHAGSQKVYRMDLPGAWIDGAWVSAAAGAVCHGRIVAEHCLTHGQFFGFVQTFCRGYLLACQHAERGALHHLAPPTVMHPEAEPCPTR